jgi:hypothetical protein
MIDDTAPTSDAPPAAVLMSMVTGRWVAQTISAAAELGLADVLDAGPLTPDAIGSRIGADGPSLHRLLRALASLDIFREDADGRFHQTPLSAPLRSDVPGSLRGWARYLGSRASLLAWADLATSIRTGEPAFRRVFGKSFFEHLQTAPDDAAAFDDAMHGVSASEIPAVLAAYDFAGCGTIVDVGGGDGTLLAAVLGQHAGLHGILYDLDHVAARARTRLAGTPVGARIEIAAGSFFDTVPRGGDTYLLKHILHDWSDEHCFRILRAVRGVLPAGGRVLVVECVLKPGNDPDFGKLLDLEMIAVTEGGRERSGAEFAALFAAAGFRVGRVVPTAAPTSVIEALPA